MTTTHTLAFLQLPGAAQVMKVRAEFLDYLRRSTTVIKGPSGVLGYEDVYLLPAVDYEYYRDRLNEFARQLLADMGITTPTELVDGRLQFVESPESTEVWVCPFCGERESFTGIDNHMSGSQSVYVDEEGGVDYSSYDSEIGSFDQVDCGTCDRPIWVAWTPTMEDFILLRGRLGYLPSADEAAVSAVYDKLAAYFGIAEG